MSRRMRCLLCLAAWETWTSSRGSLQYLCLGEGAGNGIYFLGYGATRLLSGSGTQPQYAQKTNAVPRLACSIV